MPDNQPISLDPDDFLLFTDRALDRMLRIIEDLGDDLANRKPDLSNANSPFAILTHCIGVADYWIGNLIGNRGIPRERHTEFTATGTAQEIRPRIQALKRRLREDIATLDGHAPPRETPPTSYDPAGGPANWTQGAALIHTYEELAQHHGQMEITRDLLRRRQ
jgi:hypothetical protein